MIYTGANTDIELDTEEDLSQATDTKIRYRKPSGDTGEWEAETSDTEIVYTTTKEEIDEVGQWEFQALWVIAGKLSIGSIHRERVYEPIPAT